MLRGLVIHSFPVNPPFSVSAKSSSRPKFGNCSAVTSWHAGPQRAGAWPLPVLAPGNAPRGAAETSNCTSPDTGQSDSAGLPSVVTANADFYFLLVRETNPALENA